jgi:hypothetical protein
MSAITWREQEIKKKNMFYYFVLKRFNEVIVYSVISLKQRSTCKNFTYFDTNTHVILCYRRKMEERTIERKKNGGIFLLSHHIYGWVIHFGKR